MARTRGISSWAACGLASTCVAFLAAGTGTAAAALATGCQYDAVAKRALVSAVGPARATIGRTPTGAITLNGEPCEDATVTNVDEVHVAPFLDYPEIEISLVSGHLAPGFTDEPGASDEIEFNLSTTAIPGHHFPVERVVVTGTEGPDVIAVSGGAGSDRVNLNAGESDGVDTELSGFARLTVDAGHADDLVRLNGSAATGEAPSQRGAIVRGGAGADRLVGGDGGDVLRGGDGDDDVDGGPGPDWVYGDAGDDVVVGGTALDAYPDVVGGGAGADTLEGGGSDHQGDRVDYGEAAGRVEIDLNAGVATADGHGTADVAVGFEDAFTGAGDDLIVTTEASANVDSGAGADVIRTGGGNDLVSAGIGADVVRTGGGGDVVWAGGGDDDVVLADGDDKVYADGGDDRLDAGAGDDTLRGDAGDDRFDGGAGRDVAQLGLEPRSVDAFLGEDRATFRDGSGSEPLTAVEDLEDGSGEDLLVGDAGPNRLVGDQVRGGAGPDELDGGTADYSDAPLPIRATPGRVTEDGYGSADVVLTSRIRGSRLGDRFDGVMWPVVDGYGGDDWISGGDGADLQQLSGGAGADEIDGGDGPDWVSGGPGADRLHGGTNGQSGGDILLYADAPAGVHLDVARGLALDDGSGSLDVLDGFEQHHGSPHADRIVGSDVADQLYGDAGNDMVDGRGGDDQFYGEPGNDTLEGGAGRDLLKFYLDNKLGVTVDLGAGTASDPVIGGRDAVAGIEDVVGTPARDTLTGDGEANTLDGGYGNDVISGAAGDDVLTTRASHQVSDGAYPILEGGDGNDRLMGGSYTLLRGGPGDDRLHARFSPSIADYRDAPAGIVVDRRTETVQDGTGGVDTLVDLYVIEGSAHADRYFGSATPGVFRANGGDDDAVGGTAWDRLEGGPGEDSLDGGPGADNLDGGPGRDLAIGGDGEDEIYLADDTSDEARCGAAHDRVEADAPEVDAVAGDCENVTRRTSPPSPSPDPVPDPNDPPPPGPDDPPSPGPEDPPSPGPEDPPPPDPEDPPSPDGDAGPAAAPPSGSSPAARAPRDATAPRLRAVRVGPVVRLFLGERGWVAVVLERRRRSACAGKLCWSHRPVRRRAWRWTRGSHAVRLRTLATGLPSGTYRATFRAVDDAGNASPVRRLVFAHRRRARS